jgi:hypothetical protein
VRSDQEAPRRRSETGEPGISIHRGLLLGEKAPGGAAGSPR